MHLIITRLILGQYRSNISITTLIYFFFYDNTSNLKATIKGDNLKDNIRLVLEKYLQNG